MSEIVQIDEAKEEKDKRTRKPKTTQVLLLRGYVSVDATVISHGLVPGRKISGGEFEYEEVPATLAKLNKGDIVDLPEKEAAALIRADKACRPDEATDTQLIRAGLKAAPMDEAEELG